MKKRVAAALALAMVLAAAPASANWLFARWGMTPDQLKAGNDAREGFVPLTQWVNVADDPASTPESRILVRAQAEPDDTSQPMHIRFGFDRDTRLNRVRLEPMNAEQCSGIHQQFQALLGQPAPRDRALMPQLLRWRERGENDVEIRIDGELASPRGCTIEFRPARSLP